jgi:hypothetical protein
MSATLIESKSEIIKRNIVKLEWKIENYNVAFSHYKQSVDLPEGLKL